MSHRFFFQSDPREPPQVGHQIELDDQESHHLLHVMRGGIGDRVELFDGSGFQFSGEIEELGRRTVRVRVREREQVDRELDRRLTIAVPFPKADRQKFLVEKLTEIGVARLVFLATARSSVKGNENSIRKLQRLVIEASKQCRRNRLMEIAGPLALDLFIAEMTGDQATNADCYFASPTASEPIPSRLVPQREQCMVIGPEGGLDDREIVLLAEAGWQAIRLGPTILRMETAALVTAALLADR